MIYKHMFLSDSFVILIFISVVFIAIWKSQTKETFSDGIGAMLQLNSKDIQDAYITNDSTNYVSSEILDYYKKNDDKWIDFAAPTFNAIYPPPYPYYN